VSGAAAHDKKLDFFKMKKLSQLEMTMQTWHFTLVGNGKQIIYKQEIPGITGGAMDSNESEPGPIMIQGDHGPVEYRNIILTPAK
jgi:hypothetical protein